MVPTFALDIFVLLICALFAYALRKRGRRSLPYPPGPPALPIMGNVFNIPKRHAWRTYALWSKQSGFPLVHMSVFGQHIVIVNDAEAAFELFDKRSSIYSDRPHQVMVGDLVGINKLNFGLMHYGDQWRECRKIFHRYFDREASRAFHQKQIESAHELLRRLLASPEDLFTHLRYVPSSLIVSIAYGIQTEPRNDPYVTLIEESNQAILQSVTAGAYLVDYIPWLKYVPEFCADFKRQARIWAEATETAYHLPLQKVKDALSNPEPVNTALHDSVAADALNAIDDKHGYEFQEHCIKAATGTMYAAGSDTTGAVMNWFFIAMMLWPDVQTAAQKQIDEVLGNERLPDFKDEVALTLITAICNETMRWSAMAPTGIPHRSMEDDVYRGYYIPKNTVLFGNSWAMLHDRATYGPDVETFNPYRFIDASGKLDETVKDPAVYAFGFGRRICPGRFVAYDSLWIWMANVLATFTVSKAVDQHGRVIEPNTEGCASGVVITPAEPYTCSIRPRSRNSASLIRATAE